MRTTPMSRRTKYEILPQQTRKRQQGENVLNKRKKQSEDPDHLDSSITFSPCNTPHKHTQTIPCSEKKEEEWPKLTEMTMTKDSISHTLTPPTPNTHPRLILSVQSSASDREVLYFAQALSSSSLCKMKCTDSSFYSSLKTQESTLVP